MAVSCPRCGGFFVMQTIDDSSIVVKAVRCVNCGHVAEPVMNAYKQLQAEGTKRLKREKYAVRSQRRYA